jgi:hypothetical protein
MRHLTLIFSILVITACKTTAIPESQSKASQPIQIVISEQQDVSKDIAIQFLLTASATDFRAHPPAHTISFRNVRIGHIKTPDGANQYMLCGEFLPAQADGKSEWTPFATIKTLGYEQWLGDQALGLCQRRSIIWAKGDLSSSLQSRFNSLK